MILLITAPQLDVKGGANYGNIIRGPILKMT